MKIKGSMKNLKIETAFGVLGAGVLIALAIRIYQAFGGLIDFDTGFYTENNFSIVLLYAVLGAVAVITFAISFFAGEVPNDRMPERKSAAVTLGSGLFAISLVYGAVKQYEAFQMTANSYNTFLAEQTYVSYLMKSGALPRLGECVFAVLSAIYMLVLLLKYSGIRDVKLTKMKFLSLCPLFWATLRMVQRFTRTISFMNVSSLFLELFMIAFMMMFFMYFAQMASEVNNRAISYKVISYGLTGGMLAAVVSVPKILLLIINPHYREMMSSGALECNPEFADIGFVLFVVLFLVHFLTSPRIKNMTLKETEKLIGEEEK